MQPYLIVFLSTLIFPLALESARSQFALSRGVRMVLLVPLCIFSVIYAGRIGADSTNYGEIYRNAGEYFGVIEPGFLLLMIGSNILGLDYIHYAQLIAIAELILLASIITRLRDPLFFFLIYLGAFFLNFHFNMIRNSLALLIIGAVYVRIERPGFKLMIISTLIHYSSLFLLAVQRLSISRYRIFMLCLTAIAVGVPAYFISQPEILGDQFASFLYSGYLALDLETKAIYPALLVKLAVVWLCYRNGGNSFLFITYAILVVLVHIVSPIFNRVCDLVLFLAVIDFCRFHHLKRKRHLAIILALTLIASSLLIPWNDCQDGGHDNWCLSGANL